MSTADPRRLPSEMADVTVRLESLEKTSSYLVEVSNSTRDDVREIKTALVGNSELKTRGFVQRLETVEVSDAEQNKKLLAWGTVVTGIGAGLTALREWLSK